SDEQRVNLAYRWAYGRAATPDEIQFNLKFLQVVSENQGKDRLSALGQFTQAILAANEFAWID
ncbi:unnamed protein product, partial [marine sediment metagenome]